jgi:hypothetical protein
VAIRPLPSIATVRSVVFSLQLRRLGGTVPITPFLQGQAFDPELVGAMGKAFDATCEALGLSDRGDRMNELVAQKIIELAQRGLREPAELSLAALKGLKSNI